MKQDQQIDAVIYMEYETLISLFIFILSRVKRLDTAFGLVTGFI
jgi:hypothetical protein